MMLYISVTLCFGFYGILVYFINYLINGLKNTNENFEKMIIELTEQKKVNKELIESNKQLEEENIKLITNNKQLNDNNNEIHTKYLKNPYFFTVNKFCVNTDFIRIKVFTDYDLAVAEYNNDKLKFLGWDYIIPNIMEIIEDFFIHKESGYIEYDAREGLNWKQPHGVSLHVCKSTIENNTGILFKENLFRIYPDK